MSDVLPLFDVEPYYVPAPEPAVKLSTDARRTQRQLEALAGGWHPLSAAGYRIRLHVGAPVDRLDRDAPGLRCGGCAFRELAGHHNRSYGKCFFPGGERPRTGWPRITHGPGTDIRAWWPACVDYQPREES